MLKLGVKIRYQGRPGMVVARTLDVEPTYDLRLQDGTVVKYLLPAQFEVVGAEKQTDAA